jgi:hypothetical protein
VAAGEPVTLTVTADDTRFGFGRLRRRTGPADPGCTLAASTWPSWVSGTLTLPLAPLAGVFTGTVALATGAIPTQGLTPGTRLLLIEAPGCWRHLGGAHGNFFADWQNSPLVSASCATLKMESNPMVEPSVDGCRRLAGRRDRSVPARLAAAAQAWRGFRQSAEAVSLGGGRVADRNRLPLPVELAEPALFFRG